MTTFPLTPTITTGEIAFGESGFEVPAVPVLQGPPGPAGDGGSVPSAVTSGTGTAYIVALPDGPDEMAGLIVLRLHVLNGESPGININGLGLVPLLLKGGAVPPAGSLPANQPLLAEMADTGVTILNEV